MKWKSETPLDDETRKLLLNELLGYYRQSRMSTAEGNGKSIEMIIGITCAATLLVAGGSDKATAINTSMACANVPERYRQALSEAIQMWLESHVVGAE